MIIIIIIIIIIIMFFSDLLRMTREIKIHVYAKRQT